MAVQVTVVGPKAKRLPDAGVQTGVIEPSTRSVAVAVNGTLAPDGPVASNEKRRYSYDRRSCINDCYRK